MRICAVAAGKTKVKISKAAAAEDGSRSGAEQDEQREEGPVTEFTVGPHGHFKVKPGTVCIVRNPMYLDAVLHITSLSWFET